MGVVDVTEELSQPAQAVAGGLRVDVDRAGDGAGPLVALFHGLEGSSSSHYALRLGALALARGWRIAVPHFRGCSGTLNRLPRAYHSGDSAEVGWMLERLQPSYAAGVSFLRLRPTSG